MELSGFMVEEENETEVDDEICEAGFDRAKCLVV